MDLCINRLWVNNVKKYCRYLRDEVVKDSCLFSWCSCNLFFVDNCGCNNLGIKSNWCELFFLFVVFVYWIGCFVNVCVWFYNLYVLK